jgi:hypothetical protein
LLFTAENELLLSCIRFGLDPNPIPQIEEISKRQLDWHYLLRNAHRNGIAPLLYDHLLKSGADGEVPCWVTKELAQAYHAVGYQNLRSYGELRDILHFLETLGIEVIVLKGAMLVEIVWGNVGLRPIGDIDLLVQEHDLDKVDQLLSELGYHSYEGYKSKDWYRKNHHHLSPYHHPEKGVAVEIHYQLVPPNKLFSIDIRKVWERAQPARIEGVDTKILAPEDLVIHLCLHLSYCDLFIGRIRNLVDLSRAINYYGQRINWDWIKKEACGKKFATFIYYPLYLAKDVLNAGVEKKTLYSFQDHSNLGRFEDRLLKSIIKRYLFSKEEKASVLPTWILEKLCSDLLCNHHTHKRITSFFRTLFLSPHEPRTGASSPSFLRMIRLGQTLLNLAKVFSRSSGMAMEAVFKRMGLRLAG